MEESGGKGVRDLCELLPVFLVPGIGDFCGCHWRVGRWIDRQVVEVVLAFAVSSYGRIPARSWEVGSRREESSNEGPNKGTSRARTGYLFKTQ